MTPAVGAAPAGTVLQPPEATALDAIAGGGSAANPVPAVLFEPSVAQRFQMSQIGTRREVVPGGTEKDCTDTNRT